MKRSEIVEGGRYTAKVSGAIVVVRVDAIRETWIVHGARFAPRFECVNEATGRRVIVKSAQRFRAPAAPKPPEAKAGRGALAPVFGAIGRRCSAPPPWTGGSLCTRDEGHDGEHGDLVGRTWHVGRTYVAVSLGRGCEAVIQTPRARRPS